jgi:hypothetical protein
LCLAGTARAFRRFVGHPHCEETVKKSRADRRIGILGFKQHVGNKYSAARAFGSFGDPKEQRNTVVAVARFAGKYGLAVIFFAKPACQPLLLLHGGQAFFHGRKESVVIFLGFWFFSAGSRLCPPAVGQADYWRRHVPVQKNKEKRMCSEKSLLA